MTGLSLGRVLGGLFRMPCLFHALTGFYCPGCGGTRAIKYLCQGHLLLSLRYNPVVIYGLVVAAAEAALCFLARKKGKEQLLPGHDKVFLYGAIVVVAGNFIIKNVLLLYGIDLMPEPL